MATFAETQLRRYGWTSGQGLGKTNNGRAEAIKVKQKQDTHGLGRELDQYDFAWWDHVYNKAASNIVVAKNNSGDEDETAVVCKPVKALRREDIITTRRPTSEPKPVVPAVVASPLYRHFVSGATSSSDSTADAEEDTAKDYSIKWTDEELLSACEGRRFGHRGGYKQVGKEKRLADALVADASEETEAIAQEMKKVKKEKKEKKCKRLADTQVADAPEETETIAQEKKKVKKEKKCRHSQTPSGPAEVADR